jgi:DNA invertase Pin-like site-specific DNA recombinase
MEVGYARVSTLEQNLELQIDALKKSGCKKIFSEIASGSKDQRVKLEEALEFLRPKDTLVVWKLDRLGRSLKHLLETVAYLESKNIGFKSLQENLCTTSSSGKLIFHLFACLAEFERGIIIERTKAGLMAARKRGRIGGRPRKMDKKKISLAKSLFSNPELSVREICKTLNVSKSTFYRNLGA